MLSVLSITLLSVILTSVFSMCTANSCIIFVCATLTEGLCCHQHLLDDIKILTWSFLIAELALLYCLASHMLSLTLAEQNWRQNSTCKLCAGIFVRWQVSSQIVHFLAAQTIDSRILLRQLNCSSWSCHLTLMPFWWQSACTLVLMLVSSTLSLEYTDQDTLHTASKHAWPEMPLPELSCRTKTSLQSVCQHHQPVHASKIRARRAIAAKSM